MIRPYAIVIAICFFPAGLSSQTVESIKVGFAEAVSRAVDESYSVRRAHLDTLASKADRLKSIAEMGPRLRGTFSDTYYDEEFSTRDPSGAKIVFRPDRLTQGSLTIGVNLSAILANLQKIRIQTAQIDLSEKAKELASIETAFGVAELYRLGQQAKETLAVAHARMETTAKQQRDAESLLAYGKIAKADRLRVDLSHNQALVDFANARDQLANVQLALKDVLNIESDADLELEGLKELTASMIPAIPDQSESLSEALVNRGDLAIAKLKLKTLERSRWLSLAPYLPSVDVYSKWDRNFGETTVFADDMTQSLGVNLTWEIWDNGATIFDFRKAQLEMSRAAIDIKEKTDSVKVNVSEARRKMELSKETLTLREVGLEQAQEAYRGIVARFQLGAVSVTDLLLSENALNQTKLDRLSAMVGLDVAYMRWQKSLGKKRPEPL